MPGVTDLSNSNRGSLTADGPGEFRCESCRARCTRSSSTGIEYGHCTGCPDRPADLPSGGTYVEHAPHVDTEVADAA